MLPSAYQPHPVAANEPTSDQRTVTITGAPRNFNPHKLRLKFEEECEVKVESIKRNGNTEDKAHVVLTKQQDVQAFKRKCPINIQFGGKAHTISICSDDSEEQEEADDPQSPIPRNGSEQYTFKEIDCELVYNWHDMDNLPKQKRGILVQNVPSTISPLQIKEYFENEEISCGGSVAQIIFMVDGILVLFEDDNVTEKVWKFRPHRAGERPIVIFLKSVPEYYTDQILIEPNYDTGDIDKIRKYLEENFTQYPVLEIRRRPSQMLHITFCNSIGLNALQHIVDEFQMDGMDRALLLAKTDCLRVERVKELSDAEIITLFENKDRTGGGRVTRLDRLKGNAALLYFASYEDAEAVFEKFQSSSISVLGNELKVFRYYHCLYDNHCDVIGKNTLDDLIGKTGWPQAEFIYSSIDEKFLFFWQLVNRYLVEINLQLEDIANATIHDDELRITLLMGSESENISSSAIMVGHKCRRVIAKYVRKYTYAALSGLSKKDKDDLKEDKTILTRQEMSNKLTIFGPRHTIEEYVQKLSKGRHQMRLKPEQMRWIKECKLDRKLGIHIKVTFDALKNVVSFAGRDDEIESARETVKKNIESLEHRQFVHGEKLLLEFLSDSKHREKIYSEVKQILRHDMEVILDARPDGLYLYGRQEHLDEAVARLNTALSVESVVFVNLPPGVLHTPHRKKTIELEKKGLIRQELKMPEKSLKIAGFRQFVQQVKKELENKFGDKLRWDKVYNPGLGVMEFLVKFEPQFQKVCDANLVTYDSSKYGDGLITLKGRENSIGKAIEELNDLASKVEHTVEKMNKRSIARFLQTKEGKMVLQTGGSQCSTVAIVGPNVVSDNNNPVTATPIASFIDQDHPFKIGPLSISICKGDITEARTDAIVNSVLPRFDLSAGALSKAILRAAGDGIQKEVHQEVGKDFRVTSGGRLPCKKIFHVVMNENLSECLLKVLNEADKCMFTSVSLPAIGTGGAGRTAAVMAGDFLGVFFDFADSTPTTKYLNAVDIVIREQHILQEFIDVFSKLHGGGAREPAVTQTPSTGMSYSSAVASGNSNTPEMFQFGPIKVEIRQGNIINETSDAIVNSIGADFNLSRGLVSKAILQKGGQALQNELFRGAGSDIRVTSSGKLLCGKIIHAVVVRPLENSVVKILRAADNNKCRSLSIAALGTGNLGVTIPQCAKLMQKGFITFSQQYVNLIHHLKGVNVIIFEKSQLQQFKTAFFGANPRTKQPLSQVGASAGGDGTMLPVQEYPHFRPEPRLNDVSADSTTLHLYSRNKSDAEKAKKEIEWLIDGAYTEEDVEDDMIPILGATGLNDICKICSEKNVSWEKSKTIPNVGRLSGPKMYIVEAKNSIIGQIKDFADTRLDEKDHIWEIYSSFGAWKPVEATVSLVLDYLESEDQFLGTKAIQVIKTAGKTYSLDNEAVTLDGLQIRKTNNGNKRSSVGGMDWA